MHRLEACATNAQAGSLGYQRFAEQARRLLPPFLEKTENNYLMQDTTFKEITGVFGPPHGPTVHKGGALPSGLPFEP
jgi:hypothetical protein